MKPLDDLYELFTPYEIAAGAILIQIIFVAVAIVFVVTGRHSAAVLAAGAALAVGLFARFAVRSPRCGKSPMRYYMTAWGEERGGVPMGERQWPERRCSRFGTALDVR